jgi:hypothetical protein
LTIKASGFAALRADLADLPLHADRSPQNPVQGAILVAGDSDAKLIMLIRIALGVDTMTP